MILLLCFFEETKRNGAKLESAGVHTDKGNIHSCWDLLKVDDI